MKQPLRTLTLKIYLPAIWLCCWFSAALGTTWLTIPAHFNLDLTLRGASFSVPLGYDAFGRELLQLTLRASIVSSTFAFVVTAVSVGLGSLIGAALALSPKRMRFWLVRGLDTFLAFPSLLLALAWAAIRGPGWDTLIIALGLGTLPSFTRLMYVRSRELVTENYVIASKALGANTWRLIRFYFLPDLWRLATVKAPGLFASTLLAEATLSFLGIGVPLGNDSWGSLLAQSKDYLIEAPHLAVGSGIPLVLTVLALQVLTEALTENNSSLSARI